MSKCIRYDPCPECGSKDNLAVYDDGHSHCYGCGYTVQQHNIKEKTLESAPSEKIKPVKHGLPEKAQTALEDGGLDKTTVNKYKVTVGSESQTFEAIFPRFDNDNNHIANQVRFPDKEFSCEGKINDATLFGRQLFPEGGRSITVTEGYYDAMSAYQMTGYRYPNVGVMSASTAKKEIVQNFEYLNSFDTIILNFDNDEPGRKIGIEHV